MIDPITRLAEATSFLARLYGALPDDAKILIWVVDAAGRKESHWFTDPAAAATFATAPDMETSKVYIGCGWRRRALGAYARGDETEVGGIVGLWADIDVAGAGHENRRPYPPDEAATLRLVAELPLEPSIVVRTGGGLHVWWLFREPWEFRLDTDRAEAKLLAREWGATIQARAAEHGWEIDSVWDLARVLRIPGTWRNKAGTPAVLVSIASDNVNTTYNPSDFDEHRTQLAAQTRRDSVGKIGPLDLVASAEPPAERFAALCLNEPRFLDTFQRRRQLPRDNTQSGYDLALATFAVQAGWSDQEVANLLISARRRSGEKPEKSLRHDYISDRIGLARASVNSVAVDRELADMAAERRAREQRDALEKERLVEDLVVEAEQGSDRSRLLEKLSRVFGVTVLGVVQYGLEEARYSLRIDGGEIAIGRVEVLRDQSRLSNRIFETARHLMPKYKEPQWHDISATILRVLEVVEDDEATRLGELKEWLRGYLMSTRRWVGERWVGALVASEPFVLNGSLYVHAQSLSVWVKTRLFETANKRDILDRLRAAGFAARDMTGRPVVDGRAQHRSRRYWGAPVEFLGDAYRELAADSMVVPVEKESSAQTQEMKLRD